MDVHISSDMTQLFNFKGFLGERPHIVVLNVLHNSMLGTLAAFLMDGSH